MNPKFVRTNSLGATMALVGAIMVTSAFGQQSPASRDAFALIRQQYQEKLQEVISDKTGYAANITRRWEASARESGKWDENYAIDLQAALEKLTPDNLLAAGEAKSFEDMMHVLASGRRADAAITPASLGDLAGDLVYTPVTPCRIVDTRSAASGAIGGNTTRTFDVDGSTFASQGGVNASCGIPFGVARAVAMTIVVTQPAAAGYLAAWGLGAQPLSSALNYAPGQTVANTTIVPVVPGAGTDFSIYSQVTTHLVIDVVGFFAAPVATALDCITVDSGLVTVPVNSWTAIDANCPLGRTATGGGYDTPTTGTQSFIGIYPTTLPNGNGWRTWVDNQTGGPRDVKTFAQCCRVPGR
jgi:hypothetical protein